MRAPVPTGIKGLDELLSGGFAPGSCNLVEGVPGTGKTTVGIQFIQAGALSGEPGIIVTFEEFPQQMQQDALNLGWDLRKLEEDNLLRIMCTSPQVFIEQLQEVGGMLDTTMAEIDAKRILLDSVSHLAQIGSSPADLRHLVYGMFNGLRRARVTSVITKELEHVDSREVPFEEYLADCVVRLHYDSESDGHRRRYVEVLKSRGAPHLAGKHMFDLTDRGVLIYPRGRPAPRAHVAWEQGLCRTPTGVQGLDDMLSGGLLCGFCTLVAGSAGVGKTTLALQFICQGAAAGEPGIYVTFEESPSKLTELARGYGLSLGDLVANGSVTVVPQSPLDVREEKLIHDLTELIQRTGARRVVVDSITDLEMAQAQGTGLREAVYSLVDALETAGVTSILVAEVPEVFGQTQITGEHISVIVDGIILLKYVEMEGEIHRAVSVLKMRGSDHDKGIRQFTISRHGMRVLDRFEGTEGLMAGTPRATAIELAVRSFSEFDEKLNRELLERFSQLHPRVKPVPLNIPYNPDEARDVVTLAIRSRQASLSVVPLSLYWMSDLMDPRRLTPLGDVLPERAWPDHLDGLVKPAVIGGDIYAVPAIALCGVLLYRTDLLEAAGFTSPPRTWIELVEQARTVCSMPGNDDLIGFEFPAYLYEGLSTSFLANLWSNGGRVIDDEGKVHLGSPAALEAITFLRDAIHTFRITPLAVTSHNGGVEPRENFLAGRTVFLWMLPSVLQSTREPDSPVRDRVGLAPCPMGPSGSRPFTFLGGWHYAVPRSALAPQAARDFIRFMTSMDIQKERALRGGPLPTLKALYEDQEILAFNPHYRELQRILAYTRSREDIPSYAQVTRAIQRQLHPVLLGTADPAIALASLEEEVRRIITT
jgi:circadian clock protein KaiC